MKRGKEHKPRCGECGTTDMTQGQVLKTLGAYDVPLCITCVNAEEALTYLDKISAISTALTENDFKDISSHDMLIAFQKTPMRFIKQRKGRGGKVINYVEGHYMQRCLTALTNCNWSNKINNIAIIGDCVVCDTTLTLHIDDKIIELSQCGSKKIAYKKGTNEPIDIGDDHKSAVTDGLKKALSLIGVAHDVYSGEANR